MSARWQKILQRFPAHMEAARGGKQFQVIAESLALHLDALSTGIARVRRSHRLSEADELRDLLLIAGLHGIQRQEMAIAFRRFELARTMMKSAGFDTAVAVSLGKLWGIDAQGFRLDRYSIDNPPSDKATRARFLKFVDDASRTPILLDALRRRVATIAKIHATGNGTVGALAAGIANALDCDLLSIVASQDGYLHRLTIQDRLRLGFPRIVDKPGTGGVVSKVEEKAEFTPASETLLIEENPLERQEPGAEPRQHGDIFPQIRRGFDRTTLRVRINGTGNRTLAPLVVNVNQGEGMGFAGSVPEGGVLEFGEEGRVLLSNQDVTSQSFAFRGSCFASAISPDDADFKFDAPAGLNRPAAQFVEEFPPGCLSSSFFFPHSGQDLPPLHIDIGQNRFAYFVQEGFFSGSDSVGTTLFVEPRTAVGFANNSVFAPGASETRQTAGLVSLSWLERCAFRARFWIPRRFLSWTPDDEHGRATRDQILDAVERFRPAGVRFDVDFLDDRWVLGQGMVLASGSASANIPGPGTGTELWSAPPGEGL